MRFLTLILVLATCPASRAQTDFQGNIRGILSEHCWQCHGADEAQRQGGLRLDLQESALHGGDSGAAAVVPGAPDSSELIKRLFSDDPDLMMPPPEAAKRPTAAEKNSLVQWIRDGGQYEQHWAFTAPQKRPLPDPTFTNPVDSFTADRLQQEGLQFADAATPEQLCRRVYLDLIGLPPSPQQLQQFLDEGFEATVDRLLTDPAFGRKWARQWLDLARYSDTNGYEKDLKREQWIWRDWVIDAINQDMPWNQFIVEQIAGDLLPNATQDQIIATGFLRNSMVNEEGAIVPEQFRMVEMFDRLDCLGKAVLGLTTQCAQCHTHKYDPITHSEYYGLFAFLNNTFEAQSWVYTDAQLATLNELRQQRQTLEEQIRQQRPNWQQELADFCVETMAQIPDWTTLQATELGSNSGLNHPTQEADGSLLMKGHSSADLFMLSRPVLENITGLQLEILNHGDLPQTGPGRSRSGTWILHELEVFVRTTAEAEWQKQTLAAVTADFSEPEVKTDDGKKTTGPVALLIDGNDSTSWKADRGPGLRNQPAVAVIRFETPLNFPAGAEMKIAWRMGDMPGCIRFSLTTAESPAALSMDYGAVLAVQQPEAQRTAQESAALFAAWRKSIPDLSEVNEQIEQTWKSTPQAHTTVLHLTSRSSRDPRTTSRLDRGEWDQPLEPIQPHVPAALHPLPADAPPNRLGLARWLVSEESPLTARVAVNYVWQGLFGSGLVETPEDFGTRSPFPEYRDLLDWLAVDFMEHGWSRRRLMRTIVTSRMYRQSSSVSPELLDRDAANRLLARSSRYRVEAEVLRDIALSVSGLLTSYPGGESIIPPVPQNVLDYNYVYPKFWKPAEGSERYCRAVYLFRKRSMPDPMLSVLDSPNGDASCPQRMRSNTPLAALVGLNEPVLVEAARALSLRILKEAQPDDSARARHGFFLCTSRIPDSREEAALLTALQQQRQRIAEGWLNPREVATGNPATLPEIPSGTTPQDVAAWTLVSRILLNLDETVTRN